MVESSEECSHEGVGLSNIDFSSVVKVEFGPGSWEEFTHVSLHLGLRHLLGDEEDFSACLLASILLKNLGSGGLTSSVGDWDGVVVEDVVHNIVLISTEESSSVLSVFSGNVSSVFPIPGAGQTVILSHGAFRTVYSNLKGVALKKGDRIEAREKIGSVRPNNSQHVLHFEVWKVTGKSQTPQNPSTWLVKL